MGEVGLGVWSFFRRVLLLFKKGWWLGLEERSWLARSSVVVEC